LSEDVNQDSAQAKYENGILSVHLSKKEQPKEKIIEVN
jgi:HSP20 family molecular chaperone IbpA